MAELDDFSVEKQCEYKNRTYSVRDNGAVYRHQKRGSRLAPWDNQWTFGRKDEKTGYMMIAGVRVHQIVATAFHGIPEDPQMVVDHIDTNRCNNRPDNLRWLTRLENVLNNPYTRSHIAYLCGSVEAFLEDPSMLRQIATDPNSSWMRTVSKAETAKCLKHLERWAQEDKTPTAPSVTGRKGIGEWIYKDSVDDGLGMSWDSDWAINDVSVDDEQQIADIEAEQAKCYDGQLALKASLTAGAKQECWKIPTEFPLCPDTHSDWPLQDYMVNLVPAATFCRNSAYRSEVLKAEISLDKTHIAVLTTTTSAITSFALAEIRYDDGCYIHKSIRTFLTEQGAEKYYTLSLGKEWTGEDVLEDYC